MRCSMANCWSGRISSPAPFNDLQQRLNRKVAIAKHLTDLSRRSSASMTCCSTATRISARCRGPSAGRGSRRGSPPIRRRGSTCRRVVPFADWDDLAEIRRQGAAEHGHEGVMLKLRDVALCAGPAQGPVVQVEARSERGRCDADVCAARPRQALVVLFGLHVRRVEGQRDRPHRQGLFRLHRRGAEAARQMGAQQHRRQLRPGARGEKGTGVRGGVRLRRSNRRRHKSGVALRFPRINRIRWDKPASEAATLDDMQVFLAAPREAMSLAASSERSSRSKARCWRP